MKFETDEELRFTYGNHAIISHKRQFTFVHLDNPSPGACRGACGDERGRILRVRLPSMPIQPPECRHRLHE